MCPVMRWLKWSLQAAARGFWPVRRHGGRPFDPATDRVLDLSGADVAEAEVEDEVQPAAPRSTVVACPEHSHPGESQSNGKAEVSVKILVGQARTLKVALETRLKCEAPIPCTHPVVAWLFEHAA